LLRFSRPELLLLLLLLPFFALARRRFRAASSSELLDDDDDDDPLLEDDELLSLLLSLSLSEDELARRFRDLSFFDEALAAAGRLSALGASAGLLLFCVAAAAADDDEDDDDEEDDEDEDEEDEEDDAAAAASVLPPPAFFGGVGDRAQMEIFISIPWRTRIRHSLCDSPPILDGMSPIPLVGPYGFDTNGRWPPPPPLSSYRWLWPWSPRSPRSPTSSSRFISRCRFHRSMRSWLRDRDRRFRSRS